MTLTIIKAIIVAEAMRQGFDPNIALAVAKVESNYNVHATGKVGEIGLYQIKPRFAHISKQELFNAKKNAKEGIRQLIFWKKRCGEYYLACYNGGKRGMYLKRYTQKVASAL